MNDFIKEIIKGALMFFVFGIVIIAIMLAIMIPTEGFESAADMLYFIGITLIIEYAIMFLFYKIEMSVCKARVKWGEEQVNIYQTDIDNR